MKRGRGIHRCRSFRCAKRWAVLWLRGDDAPDARHWFPALSKRTSGLILWGAPMPVSRFVYPIHKRRHRHYSHSSGGDKLMFSHIMIGANDLDRSKTFYDKVLGALGIGPGH